MRLAELGILPRCGLLTAGLVLLCAGVMMVGYLAGHLLKKRFFLASAGAFVMAASAQWLLMTSVSEKAGGWGTQSAGLPVWLPVLLLAVGGLVYLPLLISLSRYRQHHILRVSVRESFDRIDDGLCFYYADGVCQLVNPEMDRICRGILGDYLLDGRRFWQVLTETDRQGAAWRLQGGERPLWRLPDGRVILFARTAVSVPETGDLWQLTGDDVTEAMRQSEMLAAENDRLKRLNDRLYEYGTQLTDLTAEKETLDMKIRIHDGFGRTIQQTRHYLESEGAEGDRESIIMGWLELRSLLRGDAPEEPVDDSLRDLSEAAAGMGMTLKLNGTVPAMLTHRRVMIIGATECLLNAARAGARTLTITVLEREGWTVIRYENDGTPPDGPIREGGGLSFVREKTEYEGGTMEVLHDPAFALILRLPAK